MSRREQLFATLTISLITFCLVVPAFATGFRAAGHFNVGSHPVAVAAGDFDGDGNLDLAVLNSNRTVSVLTGLGDATFRDRVDYAIGVDGRSMVVADINRDGKADIAIGNAGTRTVSVLVGRGDGSFQSHSESGASRVSGALVAVLNNQKNLSHVNTIGGGGFWRLQPRWAAGSGGHQLALRQRERTAGDEDRGKRRTSGDQHTDEQWL